MPIPKTDAEAQQWLIENDPEAKCYWAQIEFPAGHLIDAYWQNVLDFGPEPDYTGEEQAEFNRRLMERDGYVDWGHKEGPPRPTHDPNLKTYRVTVQSIELHYELVDATSPEEAMKLVDEGEGIHYETGECDPFPKAIEAEEYP